MSAVIKQVVRGFNQLPTSGSEGLTLTLPGNLVPEKTVLFFTTRTNSNSPSTAFVRGEISGETWSSFVNFSRNTNDTSENYVSWEAVEFGSGVNVYRGTVNQSAFTFSSPEYTLDVVIPSVSLTKSFALVTVNTPTSTLNQSNFVSVEFTSSTNLRLRYRASSLASGTISWQVVEFTGNEIVSAHSFTYSGNSLSQYPISPSVTAGKVHNFISYRMDSSPSSADQAYVRCGIDVGIPQFTIERIGSGPTLRGTVFMVRQDTAVAQAISNGVLNSVTTASFTVSDSTPLNRSFAYIGGAYNTSPRSGAPGISGSHLSIFRTSTNYTMTRYGTNSLGVNSRVVAFPIGTFPDPDPPDPPDLPDPPSPGLSTRPSAAFSDYMMF